MDQHAAAEPHRLRQKGRTLIEGESYSAVSEGFPRVEPCRTCSGLENLGHFWKDSWFDMQVDVTRMCNFGISLRAASLAGTKVDIQRIDASGKTQPLTTIDVPKTGDWSKFINTQEATVFLPAGLHTLRFKNLQEEAANIDYVTFSAGDVTVTRPAPTAGPDRNPLKGFCSGWWRNEDYASVGFQYIEWGKFEPVDDKFDWDYVEEVLDREGTRDRHVILQFVVDWDGYQPLEANYLGPEWLLKSVGEYRGNEDPDDASSRPMRATKYNDPTFVAEASEAIKAFMDQYRDDPRVFVIQVGILGFWGEWHTYPRVDWSPTEETKDQILNAYLSNLGPNGLTQIRYPKESVAKPQRGMGYTNGSATLTDHGRKFGQAIAEQGLWRHGPIGGEWPPDVELRHWRSFFLTESGASFINKGRYTTLLPPEPKQIVQKLPEWKQGGLFMQMHRQLGYNFRARQIRHVVSVQRDSHLTHLEVDLQNVGIAPFYKDWEVQLAMLSPDGPTLGTPVSIETDLRKLGPQETITLSTAIDAPLDASIRYQIAIRILQPGAAETKQAKWKLNARNAYVVLANDIKILEGEWDATNALQNGWNILGNFKHPTIKPTKEPRFPFEGSFRPITTP